MTNPATSALPDNVSLNGVLLDAASAAVSPLSDGFMYGLGLFETIKVLGGRPVFFREHVGRLRRGAAEIGLSSAADEGELRARCDRVIRANAVTKGVLKIVVFQDLAGPGELISTRVGLYSEDA